MLWINLGDKKRMGSESSRIILYSLQTELVKSIINDNGTTYSRREYVKNKYLESSGIFITIYDFLVNEAKKLLTKPDEAEYPYFAFRDLYNIEYTSSNLPLKLCVPLEECLLFDVNDYNKLLTFDYLTFDENEYKNFHNEIEKAGINTYKIMTSNFYPMYKTKIIYSWKHLFDKNEKLKKGEYTLAKQGVEAFLWCIKKEWVID